MTPAYDLSPILHVMFMGGVLALGPFAWVWLRHRGGDAPGRWRALTLVTLFLTFDLVLFGAFTRLTDSGLGCPDWPGCYGSASPVGAQQHITQAQAAMPTGPVTHGKAWIEMIHRYMATAVGVLILTLAVAAWRQPGDRSAHARRLWAGTSLAWVCIQGAFGALTVTMKLFPAIVTLHLMGGLVLLALLCMQAGSAGAISDAPGAAQDGLRVAVRVVTLLVWAQVALGGWVSTNYAVLACDTFPACQGSWWPPMEFAQGFELWRALGLTAVGQPIDFAALTAIHYTHRLAAYVVLVGLLTLALQMRRSGRFPSESRLIAGLALLQLLTGLSNVVLDWPLVAAVAHTGGAAALVVVLTRAGIRLVPRAIQGSVA